ncbi:MAG TPA: LLM class flavin-dependent oxidoreductase [Acidimicrobiia bacterium]|nr:LLM class flavin-dependent oxidoreductase [Acidimicrobiia bacterium]
MDIGLTLPWWSRADRRTMLEWCRRIDDGPFSSLAAGDRIAYSGHDLMTLLTFAAAVTERVRIMAAVVVAPAADPVRIAKQSASIDVLSDGRFTLGVGVGGREEDYRIVGAPFAGRFARLDEQVAVMRQVWAGDEILPSVPPVGPTPFQQGGPPVLTAAMGPKSLARSARWADGVAGFDLAPDPDQVGSFFGQVTEAWRAAGRDRSPRLTTSSFFALGSGARDRLLGYVSGYLSNFGEDAAAAMAGLARLHDPGALRETISALADLGCDELVFAPTTDDPTEVDRLVAALG